MLLRVTLQWKGMDYLPVRWKIKQLSQQSGEHPLKCSSQNESNESQRAEALHKASCYHWSIKDILSIPCPSPCWLISLVKQTGFPLSTDQSCCWAVLGFVMAEKVQVPCSWAL